MKKTTFALLLLVTAACQRMPPAVVDATTDDAVIDLIIRSVLFGAIVLGMLLIALPILDCVLRIICTVVAAIATWFAEVWRTDVTPLPSSISPSNCLNDGQLKEGYEVEIRIMQATELDGTECQVVSLHREIKSLKDILE